MNQARYIGPRKHVTHAGRRLEPGDVIDDPGGAHCARYPSLFEPCDAPKKKKQGKTSAETRD